MTLRVQDIKPGDVVRMELVVTGKNDRSVALDCGTAAGFDTGHLAAGNAELVVRPRPVRKGDEVRHDNGSVRQFIAKWSGGFVYGSDETATFWTTTAGWTHADGSPISWEDSE